MPGRVSPYLNMVNPFYKGHHVQIGPRVDDGVDVDMTPGDEIVALADSRVIGLSGHNGWPDWWTDPQGKSEPIIVLKFIHPHVHLPSDYWYIAEQINPTVHPGQTVTAGDTIGTYADTGSGIEIGYASGNGEQTLAQANGHGGQVPSPEGQEFKWLLDQLPHWKHGPGGIPNPLDLPGEIVSALWDAIAGSAEKAGLYVVLVVGALWLIGRGIQSEVGANPVAEAAHGAERVGGAAVRVAATAPK